MSEELYCLFIDDSRQSKTALSELGPLVGLGGLAIPLKSTNLIIKDINDLCISLKLPKNCEFKWSPDKQNWMYKNVIGDMRQSFFLKLIEIIRKYKCTIFCIIEDTQYKPCCGSNHEESVVNLLFERYEYFLKRNGTLGLVVFDSPSGDKKDEETFLFKTIEKLQNGTKYSNNEHILLNLYSTTSKANRLIQIADIIIGSALSRIAHDYPLAKTLFESYKELIDRDFRVVGGIGFKIHPGVRHRNLYHWLLQDTSFYEGNGVYSDLPNITTPYYRCPYK